MKSTFFLIFALLFSLQVDAQIGGIFKRKTKQKAEHERNREIDKALDKTADKIRGLFKKNKNEETTSEVEKTEDSATSADDSGETTTDELEEITVDEKPEKAPEFDLGKLAGMFGNGEAVDIAEKYEFDFAVTWKIETEEKKETAYIQYFPTEGMYLSTSVAGIESIIDFERKVAISFVENVATVMNLDIPEETVEIKTQESASNENFEFERTGKKKQLAGYTVEQFVFSTDDSNGEIWATNELSFNKASIMGMMKNNPKAHGISEADTLGMVLEIITTDKGKNETVRMYATEVKKESRTIDTSKYQVMNMGSFGN